MRAGMVIALLWMQEINLALTFFLVDRNREVYKQCLKKFYDPFKLILFLLKLPHNVTVPFHTMLSGYVFCWKILVFFLSFF